MGPIWRNLEVMTRYGLADVWNDLPVDLRNELRAKARAEDTMEAWEHYVIQRDMERKSRGSHGR